MLYHYSIGFPAGFETPTGLLRLDYSHHALEAAREDKYGDLFQYLPTSLDLEEALLVEVETDRRGKVVKLLYRLWVTSTLDLVLAVLPGWPDVVVKSVWANERDDKHRSLDHRRYALTV